MGACSNEATPHPPQIGGCTAIGDASCREIAAGGGGGSSKEPEAGEVTDAGLDVELTDASFCSPLDESIASAYPACAQCIASAHDGGSQGCCTQDTNCSNDPGCPSIVSCELTCAGGGASCGCGLFSPTSVAIYNALVSCIAPCGAACSVLQNVMPGDI